MDEVIRCPWSAKYDDIAKDYHDHEWGKLNLTEHHLFEMVVLEFFQAGISWSVILHKREAFRQAFKNFNVQKVAKMDENDVAHLMQNSGIIRNKGKIQAAIENARAFIKIQKKYGSFANYLKRFIPEQIIHHPHTFNDIPVRSKASDKLAKQMKKDGFAYVGSVSVYSYLQAVGLINDHVENCSFKYSNS